MSSSPADQNQPKNLQVAKGEDVVIDPELETVLRPLSKEEYEALEKSILEEGVRDRVVIDKKTRKVVEGQNRVRICRKYNIPFEVTEKNFANSNEMKMWMIQNQFARRNLTLYDRGNLGLQFVSLKMSEAAKQRQREHAGTAPGRPKTLSSNLTEVSPIDVRKEAAKIAAVSEGTIAMVKVINEKATDEEKTQLSKPGSGVSIRKIYMDIRRKELETETPAFPGGKYGLILADPPWRFEFIEDAARSVENHYATMTLEELKLLPIPSIAHNDCVLAIWAPNCKLAEACELMKAWGFKQESSIAWVKPSKGLGHYVRNQHENLLLGVKGNPPTPLPKNRPPSIFYAPRGKQHSQKPIKVYQILEKMYPRFAKIELFATKRRPGWQAWGKQLADKPRGTASAAK